MHNMLVIPKPGQIWRHYKGNSYEIVGVGVSTKTGNIKVFYKTGSLPQGDAMNFDRRLDIFLGFTEHHEQRFTLIRDVA